MKKFFFYFLKILPFISIIFFISIYKIESIKNFTFISILWSNLKLISATMTTLIPFLILAILIYLLFTNKWAFRVEKLSIGGFNILFDKPHEIFEKQVRNYLDTKRTVFKTDINRDNFKETFDSFYEIYKFFRDEIKILGSNFKKNSRPSELYDLSNEIIMKLNEFLTEHQSDYRRWYTYIEKKEEENFYLKNIGELQKEYRNYTQLCNDFEKINKFFVNKVAKEFKIRIDKWGIQ